MDVREMLETLAQQAPPVRPGYAEQVFRSASRARLRRKLAALAAATATALGIAAVSVAILALPATNLPDAAATPTAPAADPAAGPYAVSITALARQMRRGQAGQWPVIYILDHTCANVAEHPVAVGACGPRPLGGKLRRDLAEAMRASAPVEFVADPATVTGRDLIVSNGGILVILGPVRLNGTRAQVPIEIRRDGLDGQGLTYRLAGRQGLWTIAGTIGGSWIS